MSTVTLSEFQPKSSPQTANKAMKQAIKTMAQSRHCAVIWFADIVARRLFRELGYSSVYRYAEIELEFSRSRTGDFLRLAKKLEELPHLKQNLELGTLGYTQAREIIKVASPETEKQWVEEAGKTTRDGLAKKVKQAKKIAEKRAKEKPGQRSLLAEPVIDAPQAAIRHKVNIEMSSEQFARYEALWEKLYKLGGVPAGSDKAEVMLAGLAGLVDGKSSDSKSTTTTPVQINIHKCPECEAAAIITSRGEIPLSPGEFERQQCDARIEEPGQPNKATIPPAVKRGVLSRDRHQCRIPGCQNTRFLEVHHIIPRCKGGSNRPEGLVTLCSACHSLLHEGKLQSPGIKRISGYDKKLNSTPLSPGGKKPKGPKARACLVKKHHAHSIAGFTQVSMPLLPKAGLRTDSIFSLKPAAQ